MRRPPPAHTDITSPQPPQGTHPISYPQFGVSLEVPNNRQAQAGASPLVASIAPTHIFRDRSEVVVEALAPPTAFATPKPTVFGPLLRSLKITPMPR